MTYRSKQHVADAVTTPKHEEGYPNIKGGGTCLSEMWLKHGFQHTVAAKGAEEINKGEEQGWGADDCSKPENMIQSDCHTLMQVGFIMR